jgi:hypothetical protein
MGGEGIEGDAAPGREDRFSRGRCSCFDEGGGWNQRTWSSVTMLRIEEKMKAELDNSIE